MNDSPPSARDCETPPLASTDGPGGGTPLHETPYTPGCPWNDWLHAIAEALKKDPDLLKKLQPPQPEQ